MSDVVKPQPRLRIGVAGLGFGATVHVPALRSLPHVEVVAIAGSDLRRATEAANRLGIETACTSVDDLLTLGLDAVTLALPPMVSEDAAAKALAQGLPVLSEKPIASTAAVAGSLAALAEDRPTAVDFEFAELQTFRTMRELLNSGELGAVRAVNVAWVVDSWARRSKSWSWKTDATEGGGVLGLLAPHVVYLLEWLLGDISAMTAISDDRPTRSYTPPGKVAAANSVCMMGLAGTDATAFTVMLDNAAVGSRVHTWSVVCDAATLIATNTEADWVTGFVLDRMSADARQRITMEPAFDGDGRQPPMRAVAERFVEAVRTGGTCHPDFADGARVQSLIELVGDKSRGPTTVQAAHIPGRGEAL